MSPRREPSEGDDSGICDSLRGSLMQDFDKFREQTKQSVEDQLAANNQLMNNLLGTAEQVIADAAAIDALKGPDPAAILAAALAEVAATGPLETTP